MTPDPITLFHQQADETRGWFFNNPPDGKNVKARRAHWAVIQTYCDALPPEMYAEYLQAAAGDPRRADELEAHPALYYLSRAISHAIEDIKATRVTQGLALWFIYNMGYVFKTPTACFGIDVKCRDAARLADALDFLLITHPHKDHVSPDLFDAMIQRKKPLVTSWDERGKVVPLPAAPPARTRLNFGDIAISIDIGDHHRNPEQHNNMLMYQVDCGGSSGNKTIYHAGDGCNPPKMKPDRPVDVFIYHTGVGFMKPQDAIEHIRARIAFASHVLELGHDIKPPHDWRWSFEYAMDKIERVPEERASLLTWGERYLTPGTTLAAVSTSEPT